MRLPFQGTPEAPEGLHQSGGSHSLLLYVCLDDWLIVDNSESETADSVYRTISTLQELGWIVNEEKSRLTPTQTIPFLGGVIDFTIGVAKPWQERINAIASTATVLAVPYLATSPWTTGKHGRCCKPLQVAHMPTTVTPPEVARPQRSGHDHTDQQFRRTKPLPPRVGTHQNTGAREFHSLSTYCTDHCGDDKRLPSGWGGGSLELSYGLGNWDIDGTVLPHQHPRDAGSERGSGVLPRPRTGHIDHHLFRQHDSVGIAISTDRMAPGQRDCALWHGRSSPQLQNPAWPYGPLI
ncbi:putative TBC1 domain family member 2A [Apostichopus japonicus]|uniref:Putative TBC1 domain family member 2A n=1 Tax=Stichopus japonicus TaxID=307972 RepID=A0A2G8K555_STIJA|nr:putative TBC1 domain family member 2A [Apostichopus japonicus]